MSHERHAGRTGWVIGGSSGLGAASARCLAREGARLWLSSRPGPNLEGTAKELDATPLPLDLLDGGAVERAYLAAFSESPPDFVVMSSGGPPPGPALTLSSEMLDHAYHSLLRPARELLVVAGGAMKSAGRGVILILTSSGVREPIPNLAASNAMRAAVTSLAKTAAGELAPFGVRVVCVAPGRIDTQRVRQLDAAAAQRQSRPVEEVTAASRSTIPMGRYGEPDEFGQVVSFLCSEEAVYMTGTTVSVDGGKSPGLLA